MGSSDEIRQDSRFWCTPPIPHTPQPPATLDRHAVTVTTTAVRHSMVPVIFFSLPQMRALILGKDACQAAPMLSNGTHIPPRLVWLLPFHGHKSRDQAVPSPPSLRLQQAAFLPDVLSSDSHALRAQPTGQDAEPLSSLPLHNNYEQTLPPVPCFLKPSLAHG